MFSNLNLIVQFQVNIDLFNVNDMNYSLCCFQTYYHGNLEPTACELVLDIIILIVQ